MAEQITLAVIGGSGLYAMPGLRDTREYKLDTPFGKPSAPIVAGTLEGMRVAFLARHDCVRLYEYPQELNLDP